MKANHTCKQTESASPHQIKDIYLRLWKPLYSETDFRRVSRFVSCSHQEQTAYYKPFSALFQSYASWPVCYPSHSSRMTASSASCTPWRPICLIGRPASLSASSGYARSLLPRRCYGSGSWRNASGPTTPSDGAMTLGRSWRKSFLVRISQLATCRLVPSTSHSCPPCCTLSLCSWWPLRTRW